jgi:hypothetical protein
LSRALDQLLLAMLLGTLYWKHGNDLEQVGHCMYAYVAGAHVCSCCPCLACYSEHVKLRSAASECIAVIEPTLLP